MKFLFTFYKITVIDNNNNNNIIIIKPDIFGLIL